MERTVGLLSVRNFMFQTQFDLKELCREQKFIAAINCLHKSHIGGTSLQVGLPLIFNVYVLKT